jgi:hypothetical protein
VRARATGRHNLKDEVAAGGAKPVGTRFSSGDHGTKRAARVEAPENPRKALLRELDRWCACRHFVHQFGLIAKPQPRPTNKKRRRGGGDRGKFRLRRPRKHRLGLAAVKHQQAEAERTKRSEQHERAFAALADVVAVAGGGGWPETMQRDLAVCVTPQDRNAWSVKWGEYLSGKAQRDQQSRPAQSAGRYLSSVPKVG